MIGKYSKSIILLIALISSLVNAAAQDQPSIILGPDGQRLDCPFPYEIEQVPEWGSSEGPPPITIDDVNELFFAYIEDNYSGANSSILKYHLFVPNTLNYPRIGWVYLIEYIVFVNPRVPTSDTKFLAVTLNGTILEPQCEAP